MQYTVTQIRHSRLYELNIMVEGANPHIIGITTGHEVTLVKDHAESIGYQEVLVLTEGNQLMEHIMYILCNC